MSLCSTTLVDFLNAQIGASLIVQNSHINFRNLGKFSKQIIIRFYNHNLNFTKKVDH